MEKLFCGAEHPIFIKSYNSKEFRILIFLTTGNRLYYI